MLALCWLLPLMLFTVAILGFAYNKIHENVENSIVTSMDKAIEICEMQLEDAVTASRNASYLPVIRQCYREYQKDHNMQKLDEDTTKFLEQQYRFNKSFLTTMLYYTDNPDKIYFTYSNSNVAASNYLGVRQFKDSALETVITISKELDTGIELINVEGHLYMIRNLVNSKYQPYAVIIMDLNKESVFSSMKSIWGFQDLDVYLDERPLVQSEKKPSITDLSYNKALESTVYHTNKEGDWAYRMKKQGLHRMLYVVSLDSEAIIGELDGIRYFVFFMVIFMFPLIFLVVQFFYRKVSRPVNCLVAASRQIEAGKYGTTVEDISDSLEFAYLGDAFNSMSNELKYQFEQIYLEELALKDARIKALQSQINPHFLNNTLEIINWEARLNGNEKVSAMIEALSVMLEATMNRKKQQFIPLEEELSYVDSYLYIISARLGDKFSIEKDIDEGLLNIKVPRLIIQPIIENAVEHGKNARGEGRVTLSIFQDGGRMMIEVKNQGALSEADEKKIAHLLNDEDEKEQPSLSLGIRNVNRRLKIIYGEESGLIIKNDEEGNTVSTIIVKIDKQNKISQ